MKQMPVYLTDNYFFHLWKYSKHKWSFILQHSKIISIIFICGPLGMFIKITLFNLIKQLEWWLYCDCTCNYLDSCLSSWRVLEFYIFSLDNYTGYFFNVHKLYMPWEWIIPGSRVWEFKNPPVRWAFHGN